VVHPELNGSLQVLHLSEPPFIMDPAASEVKAVSRPPFNFRVLLTGVRDALDDRWAKNSGRGFGHVDRVAEELCGG
jgi:hypothetical protein